MCIVGCGNGDLATTLPAVREDRLCKFMQGRCWKQFLKVEHLVTADCRVTQTIHANYNIVTTSISQPQIC